MTTHSHLRLRASRIVGWRPPVSDSSERYPGKTGIPYHDEVTSGDAVLTVKTGGTSDAVQQLGENESYHLEVTPTHAILTAPNPLGAMHGLQTFLQLVTITPDGFTVPVVIIDDEPRFPGED